MHAFHDVPFTALPFLGPSLVQAAGPNHEPQLEDHAARADGLLSEPVYKLATYSLPFALRRGAVLFLPECVFFSF